MSKGEDGRENRDTALLPTLDYIDWMKIRKTSTVRNPFTGSKIPMRTVFSVYGAFMIVIALRYAWLAFHTLRNGPPKTELEIVLEAEAAAQENAAETKP